MKDVHRVGALTKDELRRFLEHQLGCDPESEDFDDYTGKTRDLLANSWRMAENFGAYAGLISAELAEALAAKLGIK